jgi:hypothetical protein
MLIPSLFGFNAYYGVLVLIKRNSPNRGQGAAEGVRRRIKDGGWSLPYRLAPRKQRKIQEVGNGS